MKKNFCLVVCILLFANSCKKEPVLHVEDDIVYTEPVGSSTNSYVQVGDSIYYFDEIEGVYYYTSTYNKNAFNFTLNYSLNHFQNPIWVSILTKSIKPEIFFQKGIIPIDSLSIRNDPYTIGQTIQLKYYDISAVFKWDTTYYENRRFTGKGSLEIMDTLFSDNSENYYPPQKIKFEFKNY